MLFLDDSQWVQATADGLFDDGGFPASAEVVEAVLRAAQKASAWTTEQREALGREADERWEREVFPGPLGLVGAERPPPRAGYVYLMRNERNGFTKIGFSIDPAYRERTLQSQEPEVRLLFCWPGTRGAEKALHARFADRRVRGEWFDLADAEIEAIGIESLEGT